MRIDTGTRIPWVIAGHVIGVTLLSTAALASISLALSGCSSKQETAPPPTVTVQVATAEEKQIQDVVTADAVLYPREQAAIVPKISAPVKKFYVQRGSKVHAGQLLAELEDRDLAGAVTENQGGYQQAQANYETATQKAQQDLVLAKEQLDAQQKIYDNRQALFKQGAVSQKDVTDAQIALTQARDQYQIAQKQFDVQAAEGQLKAAKGKTTSAAAQLSYARIISPISGVVTDRPLYPGETAPTGCRSDKQTAFASETPADSTQASKSPCLKSFLDRAFCPIGSPLRPQDTRRRARLR